MNELVVFDEVVAIITKYQQENEKLVFDYADKEGARQAKSHIAKLRKVKTKISEVHKEAKAEALAFGRKLDAKKNEYINAVDKMVAVHKEPLDAIEAEMIAQVQAKQIALAEAEAKKHAELEAREQAVKEKEEKIAREKTEAEEKIRREKVAESERIMKAQQEKIQRIEEEKRIAEEKVERIRLQEKEKAKAEAEAEEERLADIAAEKAIEANRIKDKKHRKKIEDEVHLALTELGIGPADAELIIIALTENSIPHVSINY